ncbi:MAG TPA: hypothetical protein VI584_08490 [Nitrospiria bacterium]|nr:hypothetical protein [Nitrospiria bacterium]
MISAVKQANFLLPADVLEELRKMIPKREQSKVVTEALRKELKHIKIQQALEKSFGAWKKEDHPELAEGTEKYVRSMRRSSREKRIDG